MTVQGPVNNPQPDGMSHAPPPENRPLLSDWAKFCSKTFLWCAFGASQFRPQNFPRPCALHYFGTKWGAPTLDPPSPLEVEPWSYPSSFPGLGASPSLLSACFFGCGR